jgi:hypothetical protein
MIKLFRNIRQKLLNDGKISKYFKYAIGEIFLVVIGILIALQINTWNESRKDKYQEVEYIQRLISENKQDLITFSNNIRNLEKGNDSILKFSNALKTSSIPDTLLIRSANEYFKYGSIYPVFTSSTSTFDDLSSTGNLKLITNTYLRDSIVNHYSKHNQTIGWLQVATNWALPLDAPFTYENDIMKFEPTTSFLFPNQAINTLAKELRNEKMKYISNAAAHYWINTDAINQINVLIIETKNLIKVLENNFKTLAN